MSATPFLQPAAAAALSEDKLPTYDGSLVALGAWLRLLSRSAHLLPAEIAFFLLTAATAAGPKTAVLSPKHAQLLSQGLVKAQNYGILHPPPVDDQFEAVYDSLQLLAENPHS